METVLKSIVAKKVRKKSGVYKGFFETQLFLNEMLIAVVSASSRQPRKGQKTIMINCWRYKLNW